MQFLYSTHARVSFSLFAICLFSTLFLSSCSTPNINASNSPDLLELRPDEQKSLASKPPGELITAGSIYLENNNLGLAKLHYATALEKDPNLAPAYVGLGRIAMYSGDFSSALNLFRKASQLDDTLVDAQIGQAQALRFEGKLSAAIETVNKAMALSPNNVMVLKELAILYDLMGQENLAEPLHKEIITISPDVAATHNNLGMNQLVQGKYPEAILAFLQALNIERESKTIKNNLATAYALNGNEEKALKIFTSTVGEAAAYNNLGYLYMTKGKLDLAEEKLRKAMHVSPSFYLKAQDNLDKVEALRKAKPE